MSAAAADAGDAQGEGVAFRADGLGQLPATYVRGTEDRMPDAVAAGFFEQGPEIVEVPAGHCPNWSRPELVAGLIADRARSVRE